MKNILLKGMPLLAAISGSFLPASAQEHLTVPNKHLNVVYILTDDQGYGDVGFTGNPYINTPNIDSLANQSSCFTNYHTGTTSAPSRSGIMTGKYCNEVGVWHTIQGRSILYDDQKTLAQIFHENNYHTALFGKWHLGDNYPYRPFDRGFEVTLWHKGGGVGQTPDYWGNDYFDDVYYRNNEPEKQKGYCTDVFFKEAINFIDNNKHQPFFCFISLNAPHGPYHVDEKYVTQYRNNSKIPNPEFYGMISNIDENVGKLRQYLADNDLDENTVFIFNTDNGSGGGCRVDRKTHFIKNGFNAHMRGIKGDVYEGGHRTPLVIHLPNQGKKDINQLAGYIDIAPTLLDICNISDKDLSAIDGVSLLPVILQDEHFERYLVSDTQRKEFLNINNPSCVMKGNWRLINRKALYNVLADPEQRNDIANLHPDIVNELLEYHQKWWNKVYKSNTKYAYLPISSPEDEYVTFNCHDMHDILGRPNVWNQMIMRKGVRPANGQWAIEVPADGVYSFELYRWPVESGLKLTEEAPLGEDVPNGFTPPVGKAITDIIGAQLNIGSSNYLLFPDSLDKKTHISFDRVNLKKGKYMMDANFITSKGAMGALYIRIHREN